MKHLRSEAMASFSALKDDVFSRQQRRQHYESFIMGLNAYERHKKFMTDYAKHYGVSSTRVEQKLPIKTDEDTLRESYRFLRTEEDDLEATWEQRLAKRYYDKLFKEYCLADMSRYKENKIGLRWRVEKEVVAGKGQFVCGNKDCTEKEDLSSYEVNFVYKEAGETKQALVKLRACPRCAHKLNYRKEKEKKRQLKKELKKGKRRRLREDTGDASERASEDAEQQAELEADQKSKGQAEDDSEEYDPYFKGMFL